MLSFAATTCHVKQVVAGAPDAFGNPVESYAEPVDVPGVLVAPSKSTSEVEEGRPHAVMDGVDLYVPTDAPELTWRGARVVVDGWGEFDVDGDARRYPVPRGFSHDTVVRAVRHRG